MTLITTKQVNHILEIEDSYKAPDKLMAILLEKEKREIVFNQFLDINNNLDQDCFFQYFQDEHAERKKYAQDFTPDSISVLVSKLLGNKENKTNLDIAAGTGSLTIQKWVTDRRKRAFFDYRPSDYLYQCEELSDRAIPFLLFNLMIRGMNAAVVHGDVLTREVKQVYLIQNDDDDRLKFSSVNIFPHSEEVMKFFDVRKWSEEVKNHIECPNPIDFYSGDVT